jgi:hypothetical protein
MGLAVMMGERPSRNDRLMAIRQHAQVSAHGKLIRCNDTGKIVYPNKQAGREAAAALSDEQCRFERYKCPNCRLWHLRDRKKRNRRNSKKAPDKRKTAERKKKRRDKVLERDGRICQVCGAVDADRAIHIIPRSLGGPSTWANLISSCEHCERCGKDFVGVTLRERIAFTMAQRERRGGLQRGAASAASPR